MAVPRIMHFVFGLKEQTTPFHLMHYLCLRSCLEINRPDAIHLHFQYVPRGPLWELIKKYLVLRPISQPIPLMGYVYPDNNASSTYLYAHSSDFLRLEILKREGGIYADMDTLFIAPIPDHLFSYPFVMGHEVVDLLAPASSIGGSLCNAFMMSQPGSRFAELWLEEMAHAFDGSWSRHSTFLPYQLALRHPELVHVEPEASFFYLNWTKSGVERIFDRAETLPQEAYSLHLWAHLWSDARRTDVSLFHLGRLTAGYIAHADSTYSRYARAFLPPGVSIPSALRWRIQDGIEVVMLRARALLLRARAYVLRKTGR